MNPPLLNKGSASVKSSDSILATLSEETFKSLGPNDIEMMNLLATAVKVAAHGVVIADVNGIIKWVNPAFTQMTGYSFEDAIGKSTRLLNSGRQDKAFYKNLWDTVLSGNVWRGELINKRKNESLYIEEQTITPVKDDKGQIKYFIAIKLDVTTRKKAQEALEARTEELINAHTEKDLEKAKDEAMLASLGEGLIAVDTERRVFLINKATEELLGWTKEELIGKRITEMILQEEDGTEVPLEKRPTTLALKEERIVGVEYYFLRKNGTRFPISITATPIKLNGKTIGLIEILRDISTEVATARAKSEFVSIASHQLRTPLGIMKWYMEAILNNEYLKNAPKQLNDYLGEVYRSNERIISLVNDLLSISRIEQGKIRNTPQTIDLVEIIKGLINQMQIKAEKKKVKLNLAVNNTEIPLINIDSLRFHEVMENIIDNAIEYSLEDGEVEVNIDLEGELLKIKVTDHGIGMSSADLKMLFSRFFRSQKAISRNPVGTGLGLYLVKSYVETWGGNITVDSVENVGSTFTISLPINQKIITEAVSEPKLKI